MRNPRFIVTLLDAIFRSQRKPASLPVITTEARGHFVDVKA